MPQTKRDPRAFLQRQQQPKRDPVAFLQRQQPQPARDIAPASQQPQGVFESFGTGVAGPLLRNVVNTAADVYNRPLETLERAGRSGLEFLSAFDPAGAAYEPTVQSQAARVAELRRRAEAERPETVRLMALGQQQLEARPRTTAGRIAFGTGRVLGEVTFPTSPETAVGNVVMAPFAGAAVRTAGKFVAPILQRIRGGRGAATEAAGTAVAREAVPITGEVSPIGRGAVPTEANAPLQSAFAKLGADNADDVGAMIANANRRLNKDITVPGQAKRPITAEERLSSWEDYGKLKQLTPDESRALSQVLPARNYEPVGIFEKGKPSRNISDIPAGEPNPQLDANLRELEAFFTAEGKAPPMTTQIAGRVAGMARTPTSPVELPVLRAEFPGMSKQQFDDEVLKLAEQGQIALHRHDAPGLLTEAEREGLVKVGNDYYTAATVTGPRVSEAAALDIGANSTLVQPAEKTKFLEALSAFRKAGLLRVTTHAKNIGGTGPWQVFEEAARIPGAILNIVLSPVTKRRTFTGPSFGAIARSGYEAATKGVSEARQIIRRGITDADIERLGLHREVNTGSKILDTYINVTFRLLAAEDRVFRTYALRRSLEDRARSLALTEIKQGTIRRSQLGQRTRELVKAPPEDMAASAALDAEVATFNNPNLVSKGLGAARGAFEGTQGGRVANFAIDNVVPFAKTPTNVIGAMLEASPLGYGKNVYQLGHAIVKKSFTREQERAFSQTFGRATAGSGLVALGYVGYRDGWLTGMQEDEGSKRARDTATGRVPGAILVNGSWHSIAGLAPWGSLIVLGATLAREAEQEERKAKEEGRETSKKRAIATAAPEAFGRAVLEQPLLAGTKQILEGLEQPGTMGAKALGGLVGSYIPGHVSDVGQLIDYGVQREAQTLPQRLMQRIPGVRQTLPERQDVLGQPMEAPFPLNPARSQTAQQATNPLFAELVRHDIGISGFNKNPGETDEQLRQRKTDFGRLYIPYGVQLVSSPQYRRATSEIQQGAIKTLNIRAKNLVEHSRQRFAAGPLSPAALIGAATGSQARERAKKNAGRK